MGHGPGSDPMWHSKCGSAVASMGWASLTRWLACLCMLIGRAMTASSVIKLNSKSKTCGADIGVLRLTSPL